MHITQLVKEFITKFKMRDNIEQNFLTKRKHMLEEEYHELGTAILMNDEVEIIDALVDIVYFAIGTAELEGYDFDAHFMAVHESNMRKVLGHKPGREYVKFDIVKPPDWYGPNETHTALINAQNKVPNKEEM